MRHVEISPEGQNRVLVGYNFELILKVFKISEGNRGIWGAGEVTACKISCLKFIERR